MTAPTAIAEEKPKAPQLYSVPEARRRLRVGLTKFYELMNNGEIRTLKIGARRLVSEDAIIEFIARLEANPVLPSEARNTTREAA